MGLDSARDSMAADLAASRGLDVDLARIQSLALIVGPYRNLTTLLAALLALHPHCQVLNHGGQRIPPEANFFASPERAQFDNFIRYAIYISTTGGTAGPHGGSIRASHAFQREPLSSLYTARYGSEERKAEIRSVLWKESMFTTRRLSEAGDVNALLDALPRLRFILPIRNPLDCAASNARLGMAGSLGITSTAVPDLVDVILDNMAWFLEWEVMRPDRFTAVWQDGVDTAHLVSLASFLGLERDERWLTDAVACYQISSHPTHPKALVSRFCQQVEHRFSDNAAVRDRLLALVHQDA